MFTRKRKDTGKNVMKKLLEELEAKKAERFVDEEFPANDKSVGRHLKNLVWLRASEFAEGGEPKLFCDGIGPEDIRQGALGDCYFLSSLSVLAEKAERVEALFSHHEANRFGAYCVTLYCDGVLTDVVVDDSFPCDMKTRKPLFSHGNGPELWVLLLEKAYAKLHGSYYAIENGNAAAALSDLTGGPCFVGKVGEQADDEVWATLTLHDRLDHVMCCSVAEARGRDLEAEVGLVAKHSYALLDAREYRGSRLLHVRNPWGKTEWKGRWGDADAASWTPDAKRALHYVDADDGSFWIAYEDWKRYFENYTVLVLEDGWGFSSSAVTATAPQTCFVLRTAEQTDLFLTAHVPDSDVGSRLCVLALDRPYFALGGSRDSFMASSVVSSDRLRLPRGEFLVLFEVFKEHAAKLPLRIALSAYSTSDAVAVSADLDAAAAAASKEAAFTLPSYAQKYGTCATCGTALPAAHYTVKGKKFHKYCMQCYYCGARLAASVAFKDGEIACKDCAAGRKTVDAPAAPACRAEVAARRAQLDRDRVPALPDSVRARRAAEAQERERMQKKKQQQDPAAAAEAAQEIDLKKLCKEQRKAAKSVRKRITDADVRRVFSMVDVDGSGSVEDAELDDLVVVLGIPISLIPEVKRLQMQHLMGELDEDGSGAVDFKEFRAWFKRTDMKRLAKRMNSLEKSALYFLSFDKNGSGELAGAEIKSLHEALRKAKLLKDDYDTFLHAIDTDGSNSISFDEFIAWMDEKGKSSLFRR